MITNVDRHDAGVYRCIADNGFTQQASKVRVDYAVTLNTINSKTTFFYFNFIDL